MQLDLVCMECQLRRQRLAVEEMPDRAAARAYVRDCMRILADMPDGVAAPWLAPRFVEAWNRHFPPVDRYEAEKRAANDYALRVEADIRARIAAEPDPLYAALNYARVGNYLDFAALGDTVDFRELDRLTEEALRDPVDPAEYDRFRADCERGGRLLYLTDNAGEIVYDKLLLEQLAVSYPALHRTVAVRGGIALNDATREDALQVGLDRTAELIDTGTDIPGVQLSACSEAFRAVFDASDVILSKGQGNFETLLGCGANVYYLFLCKCELFTRLFQVEKFTGMFVNEQRIAREDPA